MNEFSIRQNECLRHNCRAFHHTVYTGMGNTGNPDYINVLKNTYNSYPTFRLTNAVTQLTQALNEDLPQILEILNLDSLTVCVIPRAKTIARYHANQLLFKLTVQRVINQLDNLEDGTNYIIRNSNTRTTHLPPNTPNYDNDGSSPYPGITIDSCDISVNVRGRDILLIDDLYTRSINIDEDAIQALRDNGANSVTFYSIGCRT